MVALNNSRFLRTISLLLIMATLSSIAHGKVIYVDADADGVTNGTSWANAYVYLQDALADANVSEKPVEVFVAQGIYRPDQDKDNPEGTGDPNSSFNLINSVALKGGYAGFNAFDSNGMIIAPDARNIRAFESILIGQLEINDPNFSVNFSKHIIKAESVGSSAVIEGFKIHVSSSVGLPVHEDGASMYSYRASPTVLNCIFYHNFADRGGAMFNQSSAPSVIDCEFYYHDALQGGAIFNCEGSDAKITNCNFHSNITTESYSDNTVESNGGAIYNDNSNPIITGCSFTENFTVVHMESYGYDYLGKGGAIYNFESKPVISQCNFTQNRAFQGGAIYNNDSTPIISDCNFVGNKAYCGGAIYNHDSTALFSRCIFKRNRAYEIGPSGRPPSGGGIYNQYSNTNLKNCLFTNNVASHSLATGRGSAIYNENSDPNLTNCVVYGNGYDTSKKSEAGGIYNDGFSRPKLTNCIIWCNKDEQPQKYSGTIATYSNIEGDFRWIMPGKGNINEYPDFVDPGHRDNRGTPSDPRDDVWIEGNDFHLMSEAGHWNPNSQSWVKDNFTSFCIDAGDPNSPVAFEPYPNGGIINMGAYGSTAEASKSPSGLHSKYSGGMGEPNDPYQIATAEDLKLFGETPEDYDKHFILTGDIDLNPNLPGRKVFDGAVIGGFTGVFDGNGHTISHMTIVGEGNLGLFGTLGYGATVSSLGLEAVDVSGTHAYVGGLVGHNDGSITTSHSTGTVSGNERVGGLVGANHESITSSYSTGTVNGSRWVGGLVGNLGGFGSYGILANCYSTGSVSGGHDVGGLVGYIFGSITTSYSTGSVSGDHSVGGLVGRSFGAPSSITMSFWDIETSGQATSDGGTGKTTAEMQTASTFLEAGWDFADELVNENAEIWWIDEGKDYPRLWWELIPEN
jgi:hypothetical protein